jgi:hypothetical protein
MNYLIPTIDVEALRSLSRLGSFDQLIMGKVGDDFFGTTKIAEIIKDFGGTGTFFVDFAEEGHGIDKLKKLSEQILKLGSDVQLHIHPQFISDKERFLLNQYNREEQSIILDKCIDIYKKCTNENPFSFRAGGYGADDNTLELLKQKNILVDSSYFVNHKWCKISELPINRISEKNSIIEIPVTVFKNKITYEFLAVRLKSKSLIKKLDVDGCSKDELKKGFDSLKNSGIRIIILFLHSFSLFNRSYDYSSITPDYEDIEKLKYILKYAKDSGYNISSIKDIKIKLTEYFKDPSILPQINTKRNALISTITTLQKKVKSKFRGK